MKVILLQNVAKVGRKSDVKDVSDGYALNFLLPRRLAEQASAAKIKALEVRKEKEGAERARTAEETAELLKQLDGKKMTVQAQASEKGSLYEKMGAEKVVEVLNTQQETSLTEDMIELAEPIKALGTHTVTVRADTGETASVEVIVEAAKA